MNDIQRQTWTDYERHRIERRRASHRAYYQANRDRIRQRQAGYKKVAEPTRAERREETRQAVEAMIATRHSVQQLVQSEMHGGTGDAGATGL